MVGAGVAGGAQEACVGKGACRQVHARGAPPMPEAVHSVTVRPTGMA